MLTLTAADAAWISQDTKLTPAEIVADLMHDTRTLHWGSVCDEGVLLREAHEALAKLADAMARNDAADIALHREDVEAADGALRYREDDDYLPSLNSKDAALFATARAAMKKALEVTAEPAVYEELKDAALQSEAEA